MDGLKELSKISMSPVPAYKAPVPNHSMPDEDWPYCNKCKKRIEECRHLDYGERYRVVFHTKCGGVIGVLPVPPEEE